MGVDPPDQPAPPRPNPYAPPAAPINRGRSGRAWALARPVVGWAVVGLAGLIGFGAAWFPLWLLNIPFDPGARGPRWYPEWIPLAVGGVAGLTVGRMARRVWTGRLARR